MNLKDKKRLSLNIKIENSNKKNIKQTYFTSGIQSIASDKNRAFSNLRLRNLDDKKFVT
jgi:hypothetical protein